ncbi:hypothetical protein [Ferrovum myxofaciens]|uniref:hypothetical protein n=1 Tax=Ferrovum myxofaciens TaxID=416213 RepID=UPI0023538266|nr:hypothetical protein [Ferrovum myxofaciens]MBU6993433.1 hypothetical protein [Ferrovum myxofaciens]
MSSVNAIEQRSGSGPQAKRGRVRQSAVRIIATHVLLAVASFCGIPSLPAKQCYDGSNIGVADAASSAAKNRMSRAKAR